MEGDGELGDAWDAHHPTSESGHPSPGGAVSTFAAEVRRRLPLALLVAGTTWFTMLSWRGFAVLWGDYLGPLLMIAVIGAIGGVLLRVTPLRPRVGFALHVAFVALVVWLVLGGSLLHPVSSTHHVATAVRDAWLSGSTFASPVPPTVPSLAPLMIVFGAAALVASDFFACWLRRASLAGLPLVAIYCAAMSLLGDSVSWVVFIGSAAGFLLMLFVQEAAKIARWGRPLVGPSSPDAPYDFGNNAGASRTNAATVGAVAVVLAVVLPLLTPTLHLHGPQLFGPGGGGGGVTIVNPVVDLRRNLVRGRNVTLLEIHTPDPDPSYLRIAVLTDFDGLEWRTGNRANVPDQVANGLLSTPEQYLRAGVGTEAYPYTVTATRYFDSTWLPTEFPVSSVSAPGSWHYDLSTMDFFATDGSNVQGITYQMTALKPELSATSMIRSLTAPQQIQSTYTQLPKQVSPLAQRLADRVTRGATSRFEQMTMLQDWFRSNFRYNVNAVRTRPGDGNSALDEFLRDKVGYCQQFASAFAVMARLLQMPARVAVGFLHPEPIGKQEWEYKAHEMHAWPEVFFQGSGWVRFEPTPAGHAGPPPRYTKTSSRTDGGPGNANSTIAHISQATATPSPQQASAPKSSKASTHGSVPSTLVLLALGVLVSLGLLALVPRAVRGKRRTRRLAGGVEDAWLELRDTAVDLGVGWPRGRSPRETGERLAGWFGPEPDGPREVRPRRGRGLAPDAEAALDRIVLMVEQVRYARYADDLPGMLADDVRTCIVALERGSTSHTLRRARWLPRSVFAASGAPYRTELAREARSAALGGGHDQLG